MKPNIKPNITYIVEVRTDTDTRYRIPELEEQCDHQKDDEALREYIKKVKRYFKNNDILYITYQQWKGLNEVRDKKWREARDNRRTEEERRKSQEEQNEVEELVSAFKETKILFFYQDEKMPSIIDGKYFDTLIFTHKSIEDLPGLVPLIYEEDFYHRHPRTKRGFYEKDFIANRSYYYEDRKEKDAEGLPD